MKFKKLGVLWAIIEVVLLVVFLHFLIKYPDTKSNIFSYIYCVMNIFSCIIIGAIAFNQTKIYNERENDRYQNRLKNLKIFVKDLIRVNNKKIASWGIEKETIFKMCLNCKGSQQMALLDNFESSLLSIIDIEHSVFKKLEKYYSDIKLINHYILNFNMALIKNFKEAIGYKDLIIQKINDLNSSFITEI